MGTEGRGWGAASYVSGKVGLYAGNFINGNSYVSVPDAVSLDPSSAISATAWINLTNSTGWNTVVGKELYNAGTGWVFVTTVSNGQMTYYKGGGSASLNSGANALQTWHLVAITNSAGSATMYIDGVVVATGTLPISNNNANLFIGARHSNDGSSYTDGWRGSIDDIRIYNRALSAAEVQALYNAEK